MVTAFLDEEGPGLEFLTGLPGKEDLPTSSGRSNTFICCDAISLVPDIPANSSSKSFLAHWNLALLVVGFIPANSEI